MENQPPLTSRVGPAVIPINCPPLATALEALENVIQTLDSTLDRLTDKLRPALAPSNPNSSDDFKEINNVTATMNSEIVVVVRHKTDRIRQCVNTLEELYARCEI